MVERQIVALDAVGSNPTILPLWFLCQSFRLAILYSALGCRQAVRHRTLTPALRWFESSHSSCCSFDMHYIALIEAAFLLKYCPLRPI